MTNCLFAKKTQYLKVEYNNVNKYKNKPYSESPKRLKMLDDCTQKKKY